MDLAAYIWLSGLIIGSLYLSLTYKTEFAFNIPFHFACILLAVTGFVLLISSNLSARLTTPPAPLSASYIPLNDFETVDFDSPLRKASTDKYVGVGFQRYLLQRRQAWALLAVFVFAVCGRLEMARWVITHTQCASLNFASAIPVILVIFLQILSRHDILAAASGTVRPKSFRKNEPSLIRKLLTTAILSFGAFMVVASFPRLRSTYICARASFYPYAIPVLQVLGTLLDVFLIVVIDRIVSRGSENTGVPPVIRLADPGWASLVAYSVMTMIPLIFFKYLPIHRYWYTRTPGVFFLSALKLAFVFAFTCLSGLQINRRLGPETPTVVAFFTAVNGAAFTAAQSSQPTYLPVSGIKIISSLVLLYVGFVLFLWVEASNNNQPGYRSRRFTSVPKTLLLFLLLLLSVQSLFWMRSQPEHHGAHPIQGLLANAEERHTTFLTKAATSKNIAQAAQEYRRRYTRDPPPRFDRWFKFATERNSLVIDDFDSMYADLIPFWSLSPGDIRLRVWESIANPWNYIGGVLIRKGQMTMVGHPPESHKWMLEGIMNMTEPFVKWLPDMDIAINLNDEPRSAMRWREVQERLAIGHNPNQLPPRDNGDFEADRKWIPLPGEPIEDSRYREGSFHESFYRYGAVGCHKSTRSRTERHWNLRETCASCLAEHSLFHLVSDWDYAADPCHQPDFADNYGLHVSPASFKGTNELMPVFSQSKAHGYNDILYPNPWNYVELTTYAPNNSFPDPPFSEKQPTLFWRGGTSEGMPTGTGAWKGMARQRLLHMFNNATEAEAALVLLPTSPVHSTANEQDQVYAFRHLTPSVLHAHLSADVHLVQKIDRCANRDCLAQHMEFHPEYVPPIDFQENWRYKYLIDMDGAGLSGRFLPFLRSRSLPVKSSLAREWWDSRVTAWLHFVPMDIRLTEAWSLLAYFAGWKEETADTSGQEWLMPPHEREAEKIADEGREWANKVLRKEDMEIYWFRLLLEYGRLSDDRRDELGWTGDRDIG